LDLEIQQNSTVINSNQTFDLYSLIELIQSTDDNETKIKLICFYFQAEVFKSIDLTLKEIYVLIDASLRLLKLFNLSIDTFMEIIFKMDTENKIFKID